MAALSRADSASSPEEAQLLDSLKRGAVLLKVNSTGKAVRRHFFLTPDLRFLRWSPSKKAEAAACE